MTAAAGWHLPQSDDAVLQRALDSLEDAGVDLTPQRRTVLATIHQFGWLDGPDGVGSMLLDAATGSTPEAKAAQARRVVRQHRDDAAAAEARYHASLPPQQSARAWHLIEDGTAFRCEACATPFGGYIDARQTSDAAADHARTCKGALNG